MEHISVSPKLYAIKLLHDWICSLWVFCSRWNYNMWFFLAYKAWPNLYNKSALQSFHQNISYTIIQNCIWNWSITCTKLTFKTCLTMPTKSVDQNYSRKDLSVKNIKKQYVRHFLPAKNVSIFLPVVWKHNLCMSRKTVGLHNCTIKTSPKQTELYETYQTLLLWFVLCL